MTDDELTLRRTVAAAERARAYIDDPLLTDAFARLEAQYLAGWQATRSDDTAGREALWHRIKALGMLRLELNRALEDGAMAKAALAELRDGTDNL
jgi:hypothetical protein